MESQILNANILQALASQVEALKQEKNDLVTKLEAQTVELDEANEKVFRLDSITSALEKCQKKIEVMTQDLNMKDTEIDKLKQQLTDASANLPTVSSGNMSRKRNLM